MATLAISLAGAAIGSSVPAIGAVAGTVGMSGAGLGFAVAGAAASYFLGPKIPDQHGPRLNDLKVISNTEGADIAITWGDVRVTGNMIVADDLDPVESEQEQGKGGGGGAYISTTYFATFLVSLGKPMPSANLLRVWANKKLIYDTSHCDNAVSAGYPITFYDGTQAVADPDIEAIVGDGNCPAYKGQALIVCPRWNITAEFGNHVPLIEVETATDVTGSTCKTTLQLGDSSSYTGWMQYDPVRQRIYASYGGNAGKSAHVAEIEPFTKQIIKVHDFNNEGEMDILLCGSPFNTDDAGLICAFRQYTSGNDYFEVYDLTNDWQQVFTWNTSGNNPTPLADSPQHVFFFHATGGGATTLKLYDKGDVSLSDVTMATGHDLYGETAAIYADGLFVVALERASDNKMVWGTYDVAAATWDVTSVSATYTSSNLDMYPRPVAIDSYLYWPATDTSGTHFPILIRTTRAGVYVDTIDLSAATEDFTAGSGNPVLHHSPETQSLFWLTNARIHRYNYDTGEITEYTGASGGAWAHYHYQTDTVWSGTTTGGDYVEAYANRLSILAPNDVNVSDILDDLCGMVGISAAQRDWSGITATVGGFAHGKQTAARADMEPLLTYAMAEGIATDWKLKGVELGGASVATLIEGETVGENRLTHTKPHDITLPNLCELEYMSQEADLQSAMAAHEWYSAPGEQAYQVSWAIAMDDDTAAEKAQQLLQLAHTNDTYRFGLPPAQMALEPADPITLWDGTRVRLTSVTRGHNGIIECEAVGDNPLDLVTDHVAGGSGIALATIIASSPPQLIVLDTPLLRDADDDHPGPYLTAFTYGAGFPGVSFQYSSDGQTFGGVGNTGSEPAVGTTQLVPAAADWEDWDTTNTLRVTMVTDDTLSSATNAQVLAGANAAAWGKPGRWEIVQWKTATLVSAGVYDLTNLLRGRRGSDPYIDDHAADDWFVVLDTTSIVRQTLPNAEIGNGKTYKAPKAGQAISDAIATAWTVNDEPLTPYTPITPTSSYTSPDLTLGWTRRTRKGGSYGGANSLTDNVGGPISEDSEAYTIQTLNGAGTVLGTYSATTNSKVITDTNLTTDYGAVPPTVYWRVAQDSAVVGAGHFMETQFYYIITPAENIIDGLSPDAFWKLDETSGTQADDSSGNANHGTYQNTPTLAQTALTTLGTSVNFDRASSEHATVPQVINDTDTAWSVVLFVKPDSLESGTGPSDQHIYFDSRAMVQIMQHQDGKYAAYLRGSDSSDNTIQSTTSPAVGTTCAIAVTFGNGGSGNYFMRLYINGTQEASVDMGTNTGAYQLAGAALNSITSGGRYGDGYLDCVAVWSGTELTSTNVSDIAAARQ